MTNFYKRLLMPLALLLMAATISYAQTTVSGVVKDGGSGENLAGVNIVVKGRVVGTITGTDGKFSFKVNDQPPFTLSFSFIGFRSQELEITDASKASGIEVAM
ncbi:MAG: TonB-dependent receptor, partial [Cytophagia bacterium]|nr:TonB-dependent receptor [Cytophagia bacterium]